MRDHYNHAPTKCSVIVEFVKRNPGCTRAELLRGIGSADEHDALPAYCRRAGLLFVAGPRGSQRYYPDAQSAQDADALVKAQVEARKAAARRKDNLNRLAKLRAQRAAEGRKSVNTRPKQSLVHLEPGVALHPDVKVTRAEPFVDRRFRFEPTPGWVGQITRDWRERRLGAQT
jgi:hypothetical protein